LDAIRDDQQRLRSFFHASDLPLPRTLELTEKTVGFRPHKDDASC
jgi:hypothetical protein